MNNNNMEDSGKRQKFESGAVRDSADGKPRPDLQSPYAQERIGHWLRLGSEKYAERNWEQGMNFSRCVASIERHLVAFKMGKYDEDHLAAIAVNAQFLMHFEEMMVLGVLPHTLDDMPHYADKLHTISLEELTKELELDKPEFKAGEDIKAREVVAGPIESVTSAQPEFKAGDKVRIKLRKKAVGGSLEAICERSGNIGTYMSKCTIDDEHNVKMADGGGEQFFTDELTLVGGG